MKKDRTKQFFGNFFSGIELRMDMTSVESIIRNKYHHKRKHQVSCLQHQLSQIHLMISVQLY